MINTENLFFVALGAMLAASILRKQYTPHVHTDKCPEGYPVPKGKCIKELK